MTANLLKKNENTCLLSHFFSVKTKKVANLAVDNFIVSKVRTRLPVVCTIVQDVTSKDAIDDSVELGLCVRLVVRILSLNSSLLEP